LTQELSQLSLLDERDDRFGFRDLAGVHVSRKSSAPSIGLANVRLHLSVLRDIQVEHLGGRTNKYGQFVFAVDEARDDPDELFERKLPTKWATWPKPSAFKRMRLRVSQALATNSTLPQSSRI